MSRENGGAVTEISITAFFQKGSVELTYENIKQDVLSLGFTETLEDETHFVLALNRAQSLLATEFPKTKTLLLARAYQKPIAVYDTLYGNTVSLKKGERIAFLYYLFDGAIFFGERKLPLTEGRGSYCYVAEEEGVLNTEGDAQLYAIAVYKEDTPLTLCEVNLPYAEYDISRYDRDVRRLCSLPTTVEGDTILGATSEGNIIRLPREYQGIFLVRYEVSPTKISQRTKEIEMEESLFPLFSLLVCSYLWLDDEPERAQYYMGLYREARERMRMLKKSYTETIHTDVLGWT